jgi:RNA polymerase sigma factor (sigma-70 family)
MTDWAAILAEHGPRVWRTVYRLLNHYPDAQDCYQETFLDAWKFARDQPVDEWAAFLTCLATRKAIDRLRQRVREASRRERLNRVAEPAARHDDPLRDVQLSEFLDRVRIALTELPDKQAEVFWLACIEQLSHQQTCDRLQIPVGEVRVLLHRARMRLQTILGSKVSTIGKNL